MVEQPLPLTDLEEVARLHRQLQLRAGATSADNIDAVLTLGTAVLLHASLETGHLATVLRWVDPSVRQRLGDEHAALGKDLAYLEELNGSGLESPDLPIVADALLRRLRQHLEFDERTLYRPLARLNAADVLPPEGC